MIGRLRGQVITRQPPRLLLDVNGVGYEVEAPMSTFYNLPLDNEPVTLYTHLSVREDAHVLFGFLQEAERQLFRELLRVSGVGGKMALGILSGMAASEFGACVHNGDVAALTRLPGVGKKTAERLIIEMRDRLAAASLSPPAAPLPGSPPAMADDPAADAVSALVALGYKPAQASRMVKDVDTAGQTTEEIIRAALQAASRR